MNKLEELLSKHRELVETTDIVKDVIKKHGTITGSYRWGVFSENSDIDIILPASIKVFGAHFSFQDVIHSHNGIYLHENEEEEIEHYFTDDFRSCYVLNEGIIYNLLFMHGKNSYNKWLRATYGMDHLLATDPTLKEKIKDKSYRVSLFEELKIQFEDNTK